MSLSVAMINLHGTRIQISPEGIVSVWEQWYVSSASAIDDVPTTCNSIGGSGRLDLVELSSSQAEEGVQHVVTAKYEGVAAERFVSPVYSWDAEESSDPIQTNPNFDELLERFSGKFEVELDDVTWAAKITTGKNGKAVRNPMRGVKQWLNVGGMWTEDKAHAEIPEDVWEGVWSLVDSVPGGFPTPRNRLWLTMPPRVQQRGAAFIVSRRWKMTGVMTPETLEASRLIYNPLP